MEYREEELDNVLGGAPREVVEQSVISNEDLFRGKSIDELKQIKAEILKSDELTLDELDQVKAGFRR